MTNYAVLISTKNVTLDDDVHSSAWYDLFLIYKSLSQKGFLPENIFTLYGEGEDFDTIHIRYNSERQLSRTITQWPAHRDNIIYIFSKLSLGDSNAYTYKGTPINIPKITNTDLLFVWWNGHGDHVPPNPNNSDACITDFETADMTIIDKNLVNIINTVNMFESRVLVFQTCCSGGIINDFNDNIINNTVIMTSANCTDTSYDEFYDEKIILRLPVNICRRIKDLVTGARYFFGPPVHAMKSYSRFTITEPIDHNPFNYYLSSAIRGKTPDDNFLPSNPDTNNDGKVSIAECFDYVKGRITYENNNLGLQHTLPLPQLDNLNFASTLNLF